MNVSKPLLSWAKLQNAKEKIISGSINNNKDFIDKLTESKKAFSTSGIKLPNIKATIMTRINLKGKLWMILL